jgi:hypothetical protein
MTPLLLAALLAAPNLSYLSRDKDTGAARVEHAQGRQTVKEGDEIPGWGKVTHIDDAEMRVERQLSDEERAALQKRGAVPVQAEEIIVPRRDRQAMPRPGG